MDELVSKQAGEQVGEQVGEHRYRYLSLGAWELFGLLLVLLVLALPSWGAWDEPFAAVGQPGLERLVRQGR